MELFAWRTEAWWVSTRDRFRGLQVSKSETGASLGFTLRSLPTNELGHCFRDLSKLQRLPMMEESPHAAARGGLVSARRE
jgi:hypothetical protein